MSENIYIDTGMGSLVLLELNDWEEDGFHFGLQGLRDLVYHRQLKVQDIKFRLSLESCIFVAWLFFDLLSQRWPLMEFAQEVNPTRDIIIVRVINIIL